MVRLSAKPPSDLQKLLSSKVIQVSVTLFLMILLFGSSAFIAYQTGKTKGVGSINQGKECVVGGCNGKLCTEIGEELKASICIHDPKSKCYKNAICEKQDDGRCGWRETRGLTQCLSESQTREDSSPEGKFCGGIAGIACSEGYTCKLDGDYPDAGGKCVEK